MNITSLNYSYLEFILMSLTGKFINSLTQCNFTLLIQLTHLKIQQNKYL